MKTDVAVVGWGKAGKTLAMKLAGLGKQVVLIEQSPVMYGGTCINIACLPTKKLITEAVRRGDAEPNEYFTQAVERRDGVIGKLNDKNFHMVADLDNTTVIDGRATFVGDKQIQVETADGTVEVTADTVIIGTGATPRRLDIPGLDGEGVYDSTTIQHVPELPKHLVIVGAGPIGIEFATMFAAFGSKVTLLNNKDGLLTNMGEETSKALESALRGQGVDVRHNTSLDGVTRPGLAASLTDGTSLDCDAILVAAGRTPATDGLGLEAAGVRTNERGFITVDEHLRTTAPGVYAVGDVNGGPQFTYISYDDFRIVFDQLTGDGTRTVNDRVAVPTTTFTNPPLSTVGMDHAAATKAAKEGRNIKVAAKDVAAIAAMPRPKILGQTAGRFTFYIDGDTDKVLGATLYGTDSQELINMVAFGIRLGATVSDFRDGIWTHPSSTEAFNEVLGSQDSL